MIVAKGAEAILRKEGEFLIKERIKKGYRISILDKKLRSIRTKRETDLIRAAARAGVKVPQIIETKENEIKMQFIDGKKLKDILDNREDLCEKIGESIARLHRFDIIHGDLTTSNMIFKDDVYFIDFGLGFISHKIEDKATDLYLLSEALKSTHKNENLWKLILNAYEKNYDKEKKIIKRLLQIEKRGRYRER